jgi:hypothetical protein
MLDDPVLPRPAWRTRVDMLSCGSHYTSRMRPTARSARLAGMRSISATRSGRTLRTERHTDVARRSKAPGMDRWAVLIGHSPCLCAPASPGNRQCRYLCCASISLALSDWRSSAEDPGVALPSGTPPKWISWSGTLVTSTPLATSSPGRPAQRPAPGQPHQRGRQPRSPTRRRRGRVRPEGTS